jgi:hypothetical protein
VAALNEVGAALSVGEIIAAAGLGSRNAADVLLHRMARDGEIEKAGRGRYTLSTDSSKIGQKERSAGEVIDFPCEREFLSDLTHLSDAAG